MTKHGSGEVDKFFLGQNIRNCIRAIHPQWLSIGGCKIRVIHIPLESIARDRWTEGYQKIGHMEIPVKSSAVEVALFVKRQMRRH